MPIQLNDMKAVAKAASKNYAPTFFSDRLTGRGGNTKGVLSMTNSPAGVSASARIQPSDAVTVRRSYTSGIVTYNIIPLNLLTTQCEKYLLRLNRPDTADMVKIADNGNVSLYIDMDIETIHIEDSSMPDPVQGKTTVMHDFKIAYEIRFWAVADPSSDTHEYKDSPVAPSKCGANTYWTAYTVNPLVEVLEMAEDMKRLYGWNIDKTALTNWLLCYDAYDSACRRSEQWQAHADSELRVLFENINRYFKTDREAFKAVRDEVKYIMTYNIPLDLYKPIYADICTNFSPDDASAICKENLNLLLSDTLGRLDADKSLIPGFTPKQNTALPASVNQLSSEQKLAATSADPLVLVQAGAGTGKSTLLLGRIDYLVSAGIEPKDITVLSFTNAAANHIQDLNPQVHSLTIASMINEIYARNFPNHELSSIDTMLNTIDIVYPKGVTSNRGIIDDFQKRLADISKNSLNSFTEMNNFVEKHYDDVISVLNDIGQTSLEMEIIICYQKIDTFIEPASVASKYLIIDEVQDNSIFEFIYTLKYIDKHKESLFIVGDCSQTLYEFRASNPKALNILENSGTFTTYQLNVNYRSNQEILDFANIALRNIEANQYAHIQLRANSLAPVTEQSFLNRVWFNYHRISKISNLHTELPSIFSIEVRPYIEQCFEKGEQVAVLAYTRRDIACIEDILHDLWPDRSCVSLVPKKQYPSTVFTAFIKKYWNDINFAPYDKIMSIITQEIYARLQYLVYNRDKAFKSVQDMLTAWRTQEGPTIQSWIRQVNNGQMTSQTLLDNVKRNMIDFEIRENAIRQQLLSAENRRMKEEQSSADADFVLSTIHSAKGLEFQNVIVLYKNENNMEEDKKRMYYVAMTRAMHSEYILAYDTKNNPQIEADYMTVLEGLHAIAPAPDSPITKREAKRKHVKI